MSAEELLAGSPRPGAAHRSARYVAEQPVMTPVDLKTLAQFSLIGDPSVQPVEVTVRGTRAARRRRLVAAGSRLEQFAPVTMASAAAPTRGATRSFDVTVPPGRPPPASQRGSTSPYDAGGTSALLVVEQREDTAGVTPYRELESR